MLPTVIDLIFVLGSGLVGAVAASWLWYLHIRRQATAARGRNGLPAADAGVRNPPVAGVKDRLQKLAAQMSADFAVRLQELVTQVACDVGEHNSRVQEINDELTSKNHDSTKVLDVVVKLVEANQQMQERLASAERKLHEQTDRMQTLLAETRTDALTLLANRRAFDDELGKRIAEFRRQGRTFSLAIVDVDRFKNFNDTYGHRAGDEVLRNVAKVLRRKMRETDMVARYGGEEFAIIHPGTCLADAYKLGLRACEAVANNQFVHDGSSFRITVSLGVAEILSNENASEILNRADGAMYASKEAGRNCVHFHDGKGLRRAITNQEPVLPACDIPPPCRQAPGRCDEEERTRPVRDGGVRTRADATADCELLLDLPGRTRFCQQVRNRMAEWKRGGPAFSVTLIEVSQHGERGGNIGQQARELALRVTARYLLATIREMDVLGSYTPGCFALMMPTAGLAEALRLADRLTGPLLPQISLASGTEGFSVSVGVVQAIEADDATSVLKRAEMALDAVGRKGGHRVYCHDGERMAPIAAILAMEAASYPA